MTSYVIILVMQVETCRSKVFLMAKEGHQGNDTPPPTPAWKKTCMQCIFPTVSYQLNTQQIHNKFSVAVDIIIAQDISRSQDNIFSQVCFTKEVQPQRSWTNLKEVSKTKGFRKSIWCLSQSLCSSTIQALAPSFQVSYYHNYSTVSGVATEGQEKGGRERPPLHFSRRGGAQLPPPPLLNSSFFICTNFGS